MSHSPQLQTYIISLLRLMPCKPQSLREIEAHLVHFGIKEFNHWDILDNVNILASQGKITQIGYDYTI